jgi:hypothetical protein
MVHRLFYLSRLGAVLAERLSSSDEGNELALSLIEMLK